MIDELIEILNDMIDAMVDLEVAGEGDWSDAIIQCQAYIDKLEAEK